MIKEISDLKKLFKLCREQGITEFKMDGLQVSFGELPAKASSSSSLEIVGEESPNPYANFPQGELTPEQLMFYSAGGRPEDDPFNKEAI